MIDFSQAFVDDIHQTILWYGRNDCCAVLVHGFPGTPNDMRPIAKLLHELGWTVHAPLLPGFGIEINSLINKQYDEWRNAILDVVQLHRQAYQHLVLIGYSMGGAISMCVASEIEMDRLILLAPFWRIDHIVWSLLPFIKFVIPRFKPFRLFKPDFNDPDTIAELRAMLPTANLNDPSIQQEITNFSIPTNLINQVRIAGTEARKSAPQITIPTLVIQGIHDDLVKPHITAELARHITGSVTHIDVDADHQLTHTDKPHWKKLQDSIMQFISPLHNLGSPTQ